MGKNIVLPTQTIINAAPIGQELAKHVFPLWNSKELRCGGLRPDDLSITVDTMMTPSALPNVYETGIKGIGVKFCLTLNPNSANASECVPYFSTISGGKSWAPYKIDIIFVRTGRDVASGRVNMSFKIKYKTSGLVPAELTVSSQSNIEVVNNVFFAGCGSVGAAVNVQMRRQSVPSIKDASVGEVPFNFDVRCGGIKPNVPVPVKVYSEGNSQSDGLLKLSNQGQVGVASGVGISLINDRGIKLPFDIARSIPLNWKRETADGSIYRFFGSAKYAPAGGEVKAGEGDATMNFVLEYN